MSDEAIRVLPLSSFVTPKRGLTYNADQLGNDGANAVAYFNMKSFLKAGGLNASGIKSYTGQVPPDYVLTSRDVLIANTDVTPRSDIIGSAASVPHEFVGRSTFSHHVTRLRVVDDTIDPRFLERALLVERVRQAMRAESRGTTVKMLDVSGALAIGIGVFPHHEQVEIVSILDILDTAICQTEAIIAKLKAVKEGLLHDLLTRGIDPNGELRPPKAEAPHLYKESPLGWIPKDWRVQPLSSYTASEITYGIVQAGPHIPGGVPYIRTGDMSGDALVREAMLCTSRRIANSYARSAVRAGEIVMAIRATVGKVLPVPDDLDGANLTQGTARISPNVRSVGTFLLWAIRHSRVQKAIQLEVKGTTFAEITLRALRQVPIAAPINIKEQSEIAKRLTVVDERLLRESEGLAKLHLQKSGLTDDLLTGRVRVTPLLEGDTP